MIIKIFFLFLVLHFSIHSQEEKPTTPRRTVNDEVNDTPLIPKTSNEDDSKKYSAQFILGGGIGSLNVLNDRYDPATSLSEFVALSIFSASQASQGYASSLSGNLNTNSLTALYLFNDEISSNTIHSDSRSSINRFYIENRQKNDSIGLQFGISSASYSFRADSSRNMNVFLPAAFFGNTNPIINIYMTEAFIKNSQPIYLGINTFDFALKYHFFPADKVDLYLSAGSGIGSCFVNCYAIRFFGRIGVRYNADDYYGFLEEEIQSVLFYVKDNQYNPLQERITLLGFGFYL